MSPRHSDEECLHIAYESLELMRINDMERLDKNLVKDSEFEFRVIPTSLDDRARSKKEMMAACGDFAKGTAHIEWKAEEFVIVDERLWILSSLGVTPPGGNEVSTAPCIFLIDFADRNAPELKIKRYREMSDSAALSADVPNFTEKFIGDSSASTDEAGQTTTDTSADAVLVGLPEYAGTYVRLAREALGAMHAGDVARVDTLLTSDAEYRVFPPSLDPRPRTKEELKSACTDTTTGVRVSKVTVDEAIAAEGKLWLVVTFTATITSTGRTYPYRALLFFDFAEVDGALKIKRYREMPDTATLSRILKTAK